MTLKKIYEDYKNRNDAQPTGLAGVSPNVTSGCALPKIELEIIYVIIICDTLFNYFLTVLNDDSLRVLSNELTTEVECL